MARLIDDTNCFSDPVENFSDAIRFYERIKSINNPYTGNKRKILLDLYSVIKENNIKTNNFLDLFSGSSVVGLFFSLLGSRVYSNDILSFPFLISSAFVSNTGFNLSNKEKSMLFEGNDFHEGFVCSNYSEDSDEYRFSKKEAKWLDSFYYKLQNEYGSLKSVIESKVSNEFDCKKSEENFYKSSIACVSVLNYVLSCCFVGGRLNKGQVLANKEFRIKRNSSINSDGEMAFSNIFIPEFYHFNQVENRSYHLDVLSFLAKNVNKFDCIYIDPPYGGSQSDYSFMYKFCEEFIMQSKIEDISYLKECTDFSKSKNYENHFNTLLSKLPIESSWVFSYNDSSWSNIDNIVSCIKSYKKDIIVKEIKYNYQYRKSSKSSGIEYVVIGL